MYTDASSWKKPFVEGIEVQLPSGNVVSMRPVALDELIRRGTIPDLLTPIATRAVWEAIPQDKLLEDGFKLATELGDLMALIIPASVINPSIYTGDGDAPEGSIKLEHISVADKMSIFNLAIQPVNVLASFRLQQIGSVEPVPNQ